MAASRRKPLATITQDNTPSFRTYSRKRKSFEPLKPSNNFKKQMTDEIVVMPPQQPQKKQKSTDLSISSFFTPKPSTPSFNRASLPPLSQLTTPSPPFRKTPPSSAKSMSIAKPLTQMHLANLGRATRTTIHCQVCQMDYNKIDPNDQKLHKTHHTSILNGPSFPKVSSFEITLPSSVIPSLGQLVIISRSSVKRAQVRALQLLDMIDLALGAPANTKRSTTFFQGDGKIFMVWCSGRIISLVAAERITHGYRRLAECTEGIETKGQKEKALIGISRMWTCFTYRGKGLCTALVDECAASFVFGVDFTSKVEVMSDGRVMRDYVAFSTPSESGMGVARKWTGREDFLVYDD